MEPIANLTANHYLQKNEFNIWKNSCLVFFLMSEKLKIPSTIEQKFFYMRCKSNQDMIPILFHRIYLGLTHIMTKIIIAMVLL